MLQILSYLQHQQEDSLGIEKKKLKKLTLILSFLAIIFAVRLTAADLTFIQYHYYAGLFSTFKHFLHIAWPRDHFHSGCPRKKISIYEPIEDVLISSPIFRNTTSFSGSATSCPWAPASVIPSSMAGSKPENWTLLLYVTHTVTFIVHADILYIIYSDIYSDVLNYFIFHIRPSAVSLIFCPLWCDFMLYVF